MTRPPAPTRPPRRDDRRDGEPTDDLAHLQATTLDRAATRLRWAMGVLVRREETEKEETRC
jgi:hypothetical protein